MCNVGPQYQLRLRGAAAAPRLLALTLALAAAFAAAPPVLAQTAQQAAARAYRIPAGPLEPALADFAKAAGITVSFRPEDAAGLSTQGLQGSYEAGAGLDRLLSGTGLTAVPQPGQGYVLRGAPPPPPGPAPWRRSRSAATGWARAWRTASRLSAARARCCGAKTSPTAARPASPTCCAAFPVYRSAAAPAPPAARSACTWASAA
jgi:hypothetical protein